MCFFSAPKPPAPPPIPMPVSPQQAEIASQEDAQRRGKEAKMPRSSTIISSSTGDSGYGKSIVGTRLVA